MTTFVKRVFLLLFVLTIGFLNSCNSKKDYSCTAPAGTVITNPDGSQYTTTETETKTCSDCTKKDVQKVKDQGYTCE